MARALALQCTREHVHAHIEGKLTARTAYYPKPMCNRAVTRMLERGPAQKPTSAEVTHEVYAASWEKLLGTLPPPQMTQQEADEELQKMGKDKREKSFKLMRGCSMDVADTRRIQRWRSWPNSEELIRWCWHC